MPAKNRIKTFCYTCKKKIEKIIGWNCKIIWEDQFEEYLLSLKDNIV